MAIFCVITSVPDPEQGEDGNLANALDLFILAEEGSRDNGYRDKIVPLTTLLLDIENEFERQKLASFLLELRTPVFALGEIIVIDDYGREIGGIERKPSKWSVEYEIYVTIEGAVAKSLEVIEDRYTRMNKSGTFDIGGANA